MALLTDRRFLILLALGFSAGLPLPLTAFTLRQWMSEAGVSLAAIGFTALIGLACALSNSCGRRRSTICRRPSSAASGAGAAGSPPSSCRWRAPSSPSA